MTTINFSSNVISMISGGASVQHPMETSGRKEETLKKKGGLYLSSKPSALPTLSKLPCNTSLRSALAVFYLLFVIGIGSMRGTTVTYTVTSTSAISTTGTPPAKSSASYTQTYNTQKQITKDNSSTLTLSGWRSIPISNITLSMKSNGSSGGGKLEYSIDGGTSFSDIVSDSKFSSANWCGSWSTSYVSISKNCDITGINGQDIIIRIAASENSLYCESFTITYTDDGLCDRFYESFTGSTGTNTSFSGTDGNGTFNATNTWTTSYSYGANNAAKFGNGSNAGSATTPNISVTNGQSYILSFKAAPWASESSKMIVAVSGGTINGESSITSETMTTGEWNEFEYTILANAATMTISFSASKNRFFLDEVCLTTEELATPVFTPATGTMRTPNTPITISSNAGSTIYYTVDGSTPSINSFVYTGPMLFEGGITIKAMATKAGCVNSSVGTATYTYGRQFTLATSSTTFEDGDEIVIMDSTSTRALSTTQNGNVRDVTTSDFSLSGSTLTIPDGTSPQVITLEKSGDYWLFNIGDNKYLQGGVASGNNNELKITDLNTDQGELTEKNYWSISIEANTDKARINSNAQTRNYLQYNPGSQSVSERFSCYNNNNQKRTKIYYYHRSEPYARLYHTTLHSFQYAVGYGPSLPQAINIKGYNLNDNLTVTCPSGYELSNTSPSSGFGTSNLVLTKGEDNKVNTTIYIRLSAGKSAGSYNQTLSISGGGITATSTSLIGIVSATPSGTAYTLVSNEVDIFPDDEIVIMNASGTRILSLQSSTDKLQNRIAAHSTGNFTYMESAVFTDTSSDSIQNIVIRGCDDEWLFNVGNDNYLYSAGGTSSNQLKAAALSTAGDNGKWNIDIDNDLNAIVKSIGGSTHNWLYYNGNNNPNIFSSYLNPQTELPRIFAKPSATPNVCGSPSALNGFETVSGNPSEAKVFSVKARNISTGNVRVTAPTGYKVCRSENGTYTEYIDLIPTNNNIAPTNVYVRLTGEGKGETNGNIEITATGATTRTIALTGTVTPLTVTYHSDSDADPSDPHVAEVAYGENAPAYSPANCAEDRVFVGWSSSSSVATQQTEPILTTRDGSLANVTTDTDLYAVFACRNGSAGHDYLEDFNSYSTGSYNLINTYGIWRVVSGATNSTSTVRGKMGSTAVVLQHNAGGATMTTTQKIHNFTGLSCYIATTDNSVSFLIEYSTDGSYWFILEGPTGHSLGERFKIEYNRSVADNPVDAYVRFRIYSANGTGSTYQMYIDDVVLHSKPHDWVLTDYSTSCDKQTGSATLTWNNGEGDITVTGTQLSLQTIGENITLPSLAKDNYIFEGWEVTADGQSKADGIYYGEETFLVNHNITFDAKWTQLFNVTNPNYGVTSYKDITTTSLPHTFRTVAAATTKRPVVNAVSDAKFTVAITGATLDETDSVYTFVYTYTPNAYGSGSGAATNTATVTFRDPVSGTISAPVTLRGRSLPEEFVIAVKDNDNKWYALPNTIVGNSAAIKPILISVDNKTTPSQVSYAPNTTVYKGTGRYSNDANVYGIRFTDGDDHWLQVSNSSSTNYVWLASSGAPYSSTCQDWLLTSRDFGAYILTVPTSESGDKKFGIYGHNIGYYSSPTSDTVYLLPITNKYEPVSANVYEWGEHGVVLNADMTNVASAAIHIDNASPTAATVTSVNAASLTAGKYVKVDAGELTIGAIANEGKLLYIHWKNSGGEEIGVSQIKIPCIIASDASMHTLNGYKTHWSSKEVHVLPGVTLTADGDLFNDHNVTINELHIYPGATLNVSSGTLNATTLCLRNGWTRASEKQYNTARVFVADGATLSRTTASMDYDIYDADEGRHYYPLAVPYQTAVSAIDYADTWLAGFSNYGANGQYVIKEYDGANRAENGVNDENNWDVVSADANLIPGKGYIITAVPVKGEAIIHIPLDGETTNTIAVTAHTGAAATGNKRHAGWNMLGVPYMSCYTTGTNMYGGEGDAVLMQGKMEIVGGSEPFGGYNTDVVYVTVPTHDFSEYLQTDITETTLLPGWCFFVQIGTSGNLHFLNASQAQNSETPIYAPTRTTEEQQVVRAGIILSHAEKSDKTTLLVSNRFSSDYEIGADLEKMFGSGYTLALYSLANSTRLAYNALSPADAAQLIPLGFRAPEDGEYTISFDNRYFDDPPERLDLIDYQTGAITDLLSQDYTFFSQQTQDDTRFALNVVMKQNIPTGLDEQIDESSKVQKIILHNSFFIIRDGRLYDATGKIVKEVKL